MEIRYQETGSNVTIPVSELIAAVNDQLRRYDQLVEATGTPPAYNPYQSPVYYTNLQGKVVKVPPEIQQRAITAWQAQKLAPSTTPPATEEPTPAATMAPTTAPSQKRKNDMIHRLIIIGLILVAVYSLYKLLTYQEPLIEHSAIGNLFQPRGRRLIVLRRI